MHPRVVDQHLNRRLLVEPGQRLSGTIAVGHVEGDGLRRGAAGLQFRRQPLRFFEPLVGMHDHLQTLCSQSAADRRSDRAAAAGYQRGFHCCLPLVCSRAGFTRPMLCFAKRADRHRAIADGSRIREK